MPSCEVYAWPAWGTEVHAKPGMRYGLAYYRDGVHYNFTARMLPGMPLTAASALQARVGEMPDDLIAGAQNAFTATGFATTEDGMVCSIDVDDDPQGLLVNLWAAAAQQAKL